MALAKITFEQFCHWGKDNLHLVESLIRDKITSLCPVGWKEHVDKIAAAAIETADNWQDSLEVMLGGLRCRGSHLSREIVAAESTVKEAFERLQGIAAGVDANSEPVSNSPTEPKIDEAAKPVL